MDDGERVSDNIGNQEKDDGQLREQQAAKIDRADARQRDGDYGKAREGQQADEVSSVDAQHPCQPSCCALNAAILQCLDSKIEEDSHEHDGGIDHERSEDASLQSIVVFVQIIYQSEDRAKEKRGKSSSHEKQQTRERCHI